MTMPQQSGRGAPAFEHIAQDVIAGAQQRQQGHALSPDLARVLTPKEQAEADRAAQKAEVCRFCIGYHHLPNSPGCPRLRTFELDGDGRVRSGTFFSGHGWAKGRVVFFEDTKEEDGDGAD